MISQQSYQLKSGRGSHEAHRKHKKLCSDQYRSFSLLRCWEVKNNTNKQTNKQRWWHWERCARSLRLRWPLPAIDVQVSVIWCRVLTNTAIFHTKLVGNSFCGAVVAITNSDAEDSRLVRWEPDVFRLFGPSLQSVRIHSIYQSINKCIYVHICIYGSHSV